MRKVVEKKENFFGLASVGRRYNDLRYVDRCICVWVGHTKIRCLREKNPQYQNMLKIRKFV
jgi:hypothetical protein